MEKLTLPTRIERRMNEVRGEYRDVPVEDRPYRVRKNQFNELRGERGDVEAPLSDMEILLAGGLEIFFKADGSREDANWPWTGEDKRKKPVKKVAAKKPKKKVSKKK